ncbi:hypothetical protein [Coprococcus comes]|uniref:hypothetical protein n=1 Tax=Coprococcus comes TaxID=410072 RepID=UPI0011C14F72|nr:hypothetical protein [Coprococcus comes]
MGFSYACEEVVTQIASRIQGITVEIGGDTTKLSKALESVNKSIKGTQSGLKDVNKLLKLDPSNEKSERYPFCKKIIAEFCGVFLNRYISCYGLINKA